MTKIKLKEWADRNGLNYLTANRHFHAGMIPGATQLPSGTILVEDDSPEQNMASNSSNDAMSLFLKKTVEYSKNNSSVEDFAAYVISNFTIKLNNATEPTPKYSKNRPKPEEVQRHFQQFLPDKEKQERLKAVKNLIETKGTVEPLPEGVFPRHEPDPFTRVNPDPTGMDSEYEDMEQEVLAYAPQFLDHMYGSDTNTTGGLVNRSVDFDTTPQQINYTGSNGQVSSSISAIPAAAGSLTFGNQEIYCQSFSTNSLNLPNTTATNNAWSAAVAANPGLNGTLYYSNPVVTAAAGAFQPTQKELLSSAKVIETAEDNAAPRGKRGRKPFKKV